MIWISIAIWVKKMQNYNTQKTWIYQIVLVFGVSSFDFTDSSTLAWSPEVL